MPGERDDVVLWIAIAFCLLTPVVLVLLWAYEGKFFPPMILSVLLGIAVAALTYRYLGGTQGNQLSVGALKLAGSAALLLGTTYIANEGLSKQMDSENSVIHLQEANRKIEQLEEDIKDSDSRHSTDRKRLQDELSEKQRENTSLQQDLRKAKAQKDEIDIVQIELLTPTSPLGEQILALQKKKKGPFQEAAFVKKAIRTTVSGAIPRRGEFFACSYLDLAEENIKISRLNNDNTGVYTITGKQAGRIDVTYCMNENRKFEMQIHCDDGQILFPEHIDKCLPNGVVGWKIPNGERFFLVDVIVLSDAQTE